MAVPLKDTQSSNNLPQAVLHLISGEYPGVARSAGVLTKEDVIKIKQYVKKGLALPSELPEVESYLKYTKVNIAGLEPSDIQVLFKKIRIHASSWDAVESKIIQQSIDLSSAAKNIVSSGGEIISVIKEMPIMERVKTTLGQLSNNDLEGIKYTSDDGEVACAVTEIIELMKVDIKRQQGATQELKDRISNFKIELSGGELSTGKRVFGLQSEVKGKYDLMERNNFVESIASTKKTISEKKDRITQLDKDYDYYVGMSFSGGLPIFWPISGSIFGPKAETARKERNALKTEVDELQTAVSGKEGLQSALESSMSNFGDIGIRMAGAEAALNILNTMWQTMLSKIDSSVEQFGRIDNALRLTSFVAEFAMVIDPWRDVKNTSGELVKIFNEALEEYKKSFN
ncbi:alpha-xenorhabdolysin family binary toxin subunit A [Pseudomonas sp. N3-W]|uniref:Alpha-xenorhabdolysin family binary toxin subunit A n=1 Tax=Pseudomonas fungipugnans TaxID=3024217 RepID=A0ABT6QHL5_9PSED|nr:MULTISPECIES: alpha-xenorhabdolysin family binary toxin subunit A [unclassified Pseudomonas]MDI2590241.1 alpha-xenorhabdolysin family binary toxin subunit A [Pseudomonas sp. 681]UWF52107.1 alpha-xenorhabdolysin family binary toxin subunit A [Pseudomonas sp. N3-W]